MKVARKNISLQRKTREIKTLPASREQSKARMGLCLGRGNDR